MKLIGAALAVFWLVAGCSGSEAATGVEDEAFLAALVEVGLLEADAADEDRETAVENGRAWCEKLTDPETTRADVARSYAQMLRESELEASQRATVFFATAATTYCPEAAERLK